MITNEIDFSSEITVDEMMEWMDGGSVTLKCVNNKNQKFTIEFVQKMILVLYTGMKTPGGLYLNDELIDQRSTLECQILKAMRSAHFSHQESKSMIDSGYTQERSLLESIEYIESEKYLEDRKNIVLKDNSNRIKK